MANNFKSTKVTNGKRIAPRMQISTKMHYIRQYLRLLKGDYNQFVIQIEQSLFPKELEAPLLSYCSQIIYFLKNYPVRQDGKVSKHASQYVEVLYKELNDFDAYYTSILDEIKDKYRQKISPHIHKMICDLNGSIYWFVTQHNIVLESYPVSTWLPENPSKEEVEEFLKVESKLIKKHINHKPRDLTSRNFFLSENFKYQTKNKTQRIIPFKVLQDAIVMYNVENPRKSISIKNGLYRKIRSELKSNTILNFI